MSEPGDELTPLPEEAPPSGGSRLTRSPYIALGVAAVVVSTVFATVAALASSRQDQAAPSPESRGSIESTTYDDGTDTTDPTTTTSTSGKPSTPSSSSGTPTTTSEDGEDGETTTEEEDEDTTTPGRPTTPKPTTPKPPTTTPPPPANKKPVPRFTFTCAGLNCTFDGTGSTDSDGSISSYRWTFGDGGSADGSTPSYTYGADGTYTVTLTVTDNDNASASTSQSVTVPAPTTTSGN